MSGWHVPQRGNNHQRRRSLHAMFPRPCALCGRKIASGSYCAECLSRNPGLGSQPRPESTRAEYRAGYKSAEYQANRKKRLAMTAKTLSGAQVRDGFVGRCEYCGTPVRPGEFQCDHVVPLRDGGTNELRNLRIACRQRCHNAKTRADRAARKDRS